MTPQSSSVLRRVAALLSPRLLLLQAGLALLVILLIALWLQVPDASALDVIGSLILGLILLAVAFGGETWLVLWLGGRRWVRRTALPGAALWIAALLVWWGFSVWMGHLDTRSYLYASYANSKLSHGLRSLLSYGRLSSALHWLWTTLTWIVGAVLTVPVVAVLLSRRPVRAAAAVFRSLLWWVCVLIAVNAAVYGTAALTRWVPGHTLSAEMASLVLRLLLTALLDVAVLSFLLCLAVALIERADPLYGTTPVGTPVDNQPRTTAEV